MGPQWRWCCGWIARSQVVATGKENLQQATTQIGSASVDGSQWSEGEDRNSEEVMFAMTMMLEVVR